MDAPEKSDLSGRLDAVVLEARGKIEAFQTEAEAKRLELADRFQKFLPVADRIVAIAREKLEHLKSRLNVEVIPAQIQTELMYLRSVTFDVKTDLAGVVKLRFRLTHDSNVRDLFLDYDVEIVPAYFKFKSHDQMTMSLDSFDEAVVSRWLDDRIVDFAHTYLELHSAKQHQERVLVSDTVAGITFPRYFAAATLDHNGQTYYFVSEETRREFAKRHGLTL